MKDMSVAFPNDYMNMRKKCICFVGTLILVLTVATICCFNLRSASSLMLQENVESLTQSPEEMDKCNGCNTEDEVFCCDILLPWGPYFLFRK